VAGTVTVRDTVEPECPAVTDGGLKVQVAKAGKSEQLRFTTSFSVPSARAFTSKWRTSP
jgi:hypothetical protein